MIVVKWGGGLLTNKSGKGAPRVRRRVLERLAQEWGRQSGVVVHGAGSFGHPAALRYGIGRRRLGARTSAQALREVGADVRRLQARVVEALRRQGVPAIGLPVGLMAEVRGRRLRFDARPVDACVRGGCVPVLGGDVIPDPGEGVRIVSGDEIVERLARALRPERVVFATDVDGVLKEGRLVPQVDPGDGPTLLAGIVPGEDATGGMRAKVSAALRVQRLGIETWIVNGARPGRMRRARSGRTVGTRFVPAPPV